MFDQLTQKLQKVFKNLRGEGRLSAEHIEEALKEIRMALLEADVNFKVVKQFVESVKTKALGQDVLNSLTPGQQVIKVVRDELLEMLGGETAALNFPPKRPNVFLIVGLQGSGKTTSTGKLARWLNRNGHRAYLLSIDIYRPAAREQLAILGKDLGVPVYPGVGAEDPLKLCRAALREAENSGCDVLLIDTAGRLHIDEQLMQELRQVKQAVNPAEILFVADAMTARTPEEPGISSAWRLASS
jgi:signal recognition particle subunit SRP54